MTYYEKRKEAIRQEAIDYQCSWVDHIYSYGEIAEIQYYFSKMGKRYGLLEEFHENCIC